MALIEIENRLWEGHGFSRAAKTPD